MSGFRRRQDDDASPGDEQETEGAGGDSGSDTGESVPERASSSGFLIPGDAGYSFPGEDAAVIDFDEEVGASTVADDVMSAQRSLRGASTMGFNPDRLKKIAIGVVVVAVLVALGFAVPVVIDFFTGSDDPPQSTVVASTVPATVATPTTAASTTGSTTPGEPPTPDDPSAFQLAPEAFVERWNETASLVSPSLRFRSSLPAGDFEVGFTQYIAMIGTSGATPSGLSSFTLEIDPTGPSSSDRLGIQALGLAIAVADPTLEPEERGAVLNAMGLDVRDPDLAGLNGSFTRNGVEYGLVYDAEDLILRLTVSPS